MPLEFLKRGGGAKRTGTSPEGPPEEITAQDYAVRLNYHGKSSEGVRMKAGPNARRELPGMLLGLTENEIEVVEPLQVEFSEAAPYITHPSEAMQWINAHHGNSPIARHAISVLETVGALDLAFDTFVVTLLDGETDTSGYPEYNAIVGGVASHWDEATGDMLVRALAGWGGKGVRGDTDRTATRILSGLLTNILASQYAIGLTPLDRPMPVAGRGGLVCAHCGFASVHDRAFYCPKCGMRLLRG